MHSRRQMMLAQLVSLDCCSQAVLASSPNVLQGIIWRCGVAHVPEHCCCAVCLSCTSPHRYWSFMQKRRWGGYKKNSQAAAAAAAAAADAAADAATSGSSSSSSSSTNAAPQSTLHSQLAGLRHRAAIRARKQQVRKASGSDDEASGPAQDRHPGAPSSGMEYDSTEMSDGCNMASGITDWQAAEAAHAAAASKRRFTASQSHKQQVMQQLGDLHRMAAASQERGMW